MRPSSCLGLLALASLALLPTAAAEEQVCENGLVGGGLPYEADAELPTGTSLDAEVVRCWTVYEDPAYVYFHRSANLSVEDDFTGAYARVHASEYAGGIQNEENGTHWSFGGEVVSVDVGDERGNLVPEASLLVTDHRTSINDDDTHDWLVQGHVAYAGFEQEFGGGFPDPWLELYDATLGPIYEGLP